MTHIFNDCKCCYAKLEKYRSHATHSEPKIKYLTRKYFQDSEKLYEAYKGKQKHGEKLVGVIVFFFKENNASPNSKRLP